MESPPASDPAGWSDLPSECLEQIILHAGGRAAASCAGVCRSWRRDVESDALWRKLAAMDLGLSGSNKRWVGSPTICSDPPLDEEVSTGCAPRFDAGGGRRHTGGGMRAGRCGMPAPPDAPISGQAIRDGSAGYPAPAARR
mmetsp:Transcript_35028/g.110685  ORF Transcript_35028/g.110685 Transcript_35028/m.110685 type:complete len:141 (+) Transcript_35028:147-569(+)